MPKAHAMRVAAAALLLTVLGAHGAAQQVPQTESGQPGVPSELRLALPTPPGPRLAPEWQSYRPTGFAEDRASALPGATAGRTHTIQVSTVVIVIAAVVLVLLII